MNILFGFLAFFFVVLMVFGAAQNDIYDNDAVSKRWALWLLLMCLCMAGCSYFCKPC